MFVHVSWLVLGILKVGMNTADIPVNLTKVLHVNYCINKSCPLDICQQFFAWHLGIVTVKFESHMSGFSESKAGAP